MAVPSNSHINPIKGVRYRRSSGLAKAIGISESNDLNGLVKVNGLNGLMGLMGVSGLTGDP
jgi:hypothetical protein